MPPTLDESGLCKPLGIRLMALARKQGHPSLHAATGAWGLRYSQVRDLATGAKSPRQSTLQRIADAIGVPIAELLQ